MLASYKVLLTAGVICMDHVLMDQVVAVKERGANVAIV